MARLTVAFIIAGFFAPTAARADHFTVQLKVQAGNASLTADSDIAALGVVPKKRGVLKIKAGERVQVHWTLKNTDAKQSVKDVLVHFFAVKEAELGQKTTPKLNKDVVIETALTMDFNPKDKAEGNATLKIEQPGPYLVRVET